MSEKKNLRKVRPGEKSRISTSPWLKGQCHKFSTHFDQKSLPGPHMSMVCMMMEADDGG